VGRLAVLVDDHPDIFPVNYVVDGGTVVFRTAVGLKWTAVAAHPGVAFEADGYAADSRTAWSVVVKGHADQVSKSDLLDTAALPLYPWHGEPKGRFVRVSAAERRRMLKPVRLTGDALAGTGDQPIPDLLSRLPRHPAVAVLPLAGYDCSYRHGGARTSNLPSENFLSDARCAIVEGCNHHPRTGMPSEPSLPR